jgi:pimeloyl-ACP methyl ester carboxylesterase
MRPRSLALLALALLAACSGGSAEVDVAGVSPIVTSVQPQTAPPASGAPGGSEAAAPTTVPAGSSAPVATSPPTTPAAAPLEWRGCGADGRRIDCATLAVPLDYDEPAGETIDLHVMRRPADDREGRIGSMLVNPGGPGRPGTELVDAADRVFSDTLLRSFDIVAWDPRGTGRSAPIDCVDDLGPYVALDPTPDTPAEKQALVDSARDFAARCQERSGHLLPHVSTQDSARDMDAMRRALGDDQITYFGFSYGSELGATFATMFPGTVRAMVLDGAVDPNGGVVAQTRSQTLGLERSLDAFLAACAADDDCAFHHDGDPGAAFDRLLARLDAEPLSVDGREVGQGIAYWAVIKALYLSDDWPILAEGLARAEDGDGRVLVALFDDYFERREDGSYANIVESHLAINCLDDPGPLELSVRDSLGAELAQQAPRLGAATGTSYTCAVWPARLDERLRITGAGAGPILVVGTTGDPVTTLESSNRMAGSLEEGRLLTVDAERHTGYLANECAVETVDRYLVSRELPAEGSVCS